MGVCRLKATIDILPKYTSIDIVFRNLGIFAAKELYYLL